MKCVHIALGLFLLFAGSGCFNNRWAFLNRDQDRLPDGPVPSTLPSTADIVQYLNNNAERVKSIRVEELNVTAGQGLRSIDFRGRMMAEKPRNFLMKAEVLGSPVVDIGSNQQEFWFWISKANPPYQYFCSYKDFNDGKVRQLPMPFQPEWILETMGLGPYGPADKYQLEHDARSIRLVERTRTPQGQAVRKVIVMNRRAVQAPAPQVTDYMLIDDTTGKEIAIVHISETQIDRATGAILPKRMDLRWPQDGGRLALVFSSITVNPQLPAQAFVRYPLQGVQSFDLARGQVDNGLAQVQGNSSR